MRQVVFITCRIIYNRLKNMLNIIKVLVFIPLVVFVSCTEKRKKFISKKPQNIEKRIFKDTLSAIYDLNLSKLSLYNIGTLQINKTHIFISGENKIITIQKENFDNYLTINFSEGRGPQEILQLQSFDVTDSLMVILDERQNKVLTFKLPNSFIKEVTFKKLMPHRIRFLKRKSYVLFTPMIGSKHLFNIMNVDKGTLRRFENVPSKHNPMIYEGFINTHNDNIYYAGFSEPLLKKYSSDGDLLYSVSTIDNFNTVANYLKTEGGAIIGYTPAAQFSTNSFDIFNNYWLIIPFGKDNKPAVKLDIYDAENGKYIGSFAGLKPKTKVIRADDNYIYAISTNKGEYILTLYKNIIQF